MSEIKVDKISGKTSANAVTVTGENGSTQTSLQQGLVKSFISFDGNTADASNNLTGVNDSFNVSALEDDGTGDYDVLFTNNMANTNYTVTSGGTRNASSTAQAGFYQKHNVATTGYTVMTFSTSAVEDHDLVMTQVAGDLA